MIVTIVESKSPADPAGLTAAVADLLLGLARLPEGFVGDTLIEITTIRYDFVPDFRGPPRPTGGEGGES
jgi:hypothetical protein